MFDSVDFAQNAWGSFFRNRGRVERFETPQDLVQFLVCIAQQSHRRSAAPLGTAKSNLDRESVLDPHELDQCIDKSGRFPSAIDAAVAGDELQRLLRDLPPKEQEMVQLRVRGLTQKEIGAATQKPRTTIQRIFARLFRKKHQP